MAASSPGPLLTVRAAVVLLIAVVVGIVAGVLGFFATAGLSGAILVGGCAAGGALALFHSLLDRR